MYFRSVLAIAAAVSLGGCGAARAQTPAAGTAPEPTPAPVTSAVKLPTPINSFSDVAGQWWGSVDHYTKVRLTVAPDGMVNFSGPRRLIQQGVINSQRLEVVSLETDLYCTIMTEVLTCNARFGTTYAALNLTKARSAGPFGQ